MKIALSSSGKDFNSQLHEAFGRCPYFLIVEIEDSKVKAYDFLANSSMKQMGGAGIAAAQTVAEKNVSAVITVSVGPRALAVLRQFKIEVYKGEGLIKKVIPDFLEGKLEKI